MASFPCCHGAKTLSQGQIAAPWTGAPATRRTRLAGEPESSGQGRCRADAEVEGVGVTGLPGLHPGYRGGGKPCGGDFNRDAGRRAALQSIKDNCIALSE
ncbi:hypothetical protein D3C72_2133300 [compost metagenome]